MSTGRNLIPLALATAFGIVNGVWVFGPALKEQQEQKQVETGKVLRELEKEDNEITKLHEVEATLPVTSFAELSSAAASTKSTSWWQSNAGFKKDENNTNKTMEISADNPSKQER